MSVALTLLVVSTVIGSFLSLARYSRYQRSFDFFLVVLLSGISILLIIFAQPIDAHIHGNGG